MISPLTLSYFISNKCKIPLEALPPRWGGTRLGKTLRACRACCRVCSFLYIGWRSRRRRRWWCCASSGHFEAANDRCLARPTCQLGWACLHAHLAGWWITSTDLIVGGKCQSMWLTAVVWLFSEDFLLEWINWKLSELWHWHLYIKTDCERW